MKDQPLTMRSVDFPAWAAALQWVSNSTIDVVNDTRTKTPQDGDQVGLLGRHDALYAGYKSHITQHS